MQLIKLQQEKILEQRSRDENFKNELDSLREQLLQQQNSGRGIKATSNQIDTKAAYSEQNNKNLRTYKNVKLSLTHNSLLGFRG